MKLKNSIRRNRTALNLLVLFAMLVVALGLPSTALAVQPTNDTFANAIPFTVTPDTMTINETDFNEAVNGLGDPDVCGYGNPGVHTVWYSYTPTSYGNATIDTYGSGFDTILSVWTGSFANLQEVACSDDTSAGLQSEVKISMKPGIKYYIEVIQFTSGTVMPQKEQPQPIETFGVTDYMTLNLAFSQDTTVAAPGIYDDKSSFFRYTGTWTNTAATNAYSGSYKTSKLVGNTSSITFDGYQFKLYYTRNSNMGYLQIFLDGNTTALDTLKESGLTAYKMIYTSPTFTDGIHTVQFRDAYRYASIDAIEIIAAPDLVPPSQITDLAAVADGTTYGKINLSWTAPGDDGTVGTASSYDVRYSRTPIVDDATFNAATQVTTGVPTPQPSGSAETMSVNLVPGLTYYFAIRALDAPAPDSTPGPVSNVPTATAPYLAVVGTGTYGDDAPNSWMYLGTWTIVNVALGPTDSKYHSSAVIGNSAVIVVNGSKFTFYYLINTTGGTAEVRVDGVAVKQINMKYFATTYKRVFSYTFPVAGQHTIQIFHLSGSKIYVDGIIIQ